MRAEAGGKHGRVVNQVQRRVVEIDVCRAQELESGLAFGELAHSMCDGARKHSSRRDRVVAPKPRTL